MTEAERESAIDEISSEMMAEATDSTHYQAEVESFFGGNQFFLMVYEQYTDLRLVGAPPSSIGKFGDETDNWMWPRHTGDFSIFRIYADAEGKPADYSPDNIPCKPRHFLPISLKGVEKEDFTMILGYPGYTDRYMASWGVTDLLENELPVRVELRGEKQEIMKRYMDADRAVRIKYASKYARSSNYWKYSIGQAQGIRNLDVVHKKTEQEERFMQWVHADGERKSRYGTALNDIKAGIEATSGLKVVHNYLVECFILGAELPLFAVPFRSLYRELEKKEPDREKIDRMREDLQEYAAAFFKNYDRALDREVTEAVLNRYFNDMPEDYRPDFYRIIQKKYRGNIGKYVQAWFDGSVFSDSSRLDAFLKKPSAKVLDRDPVYRAGKEIYSLYLEITGEMEAGNVLEEKGYRLYIAGLLEMKGDAPLYPDANFTMRLSYGKIDDYFPRDAVYYGYYTTLKGVMEKEDPSSREFQVPERLKELYRKKDFGRYANEAGEMPVCFISNNDITGGNSGSPVINRQGQLAGLAFDGNWEAMSGDIVFEPEIQRTISVDIRYVLFIIDKYAGANHLIDEMFIID
jgi:hypothetical protein